ncbi:MAG TPA: iron-sulfur cluster carrier protein ApbC [Gammaproteobacteria bacterium]|nr:iron-sulfur cluster carrier protein ApbC [Gammaproteobacteria bacterium]
MLDITALKQQLALFQDPLNGISLQQSQAKIVISEGEPLLIEIVFAYPISDRQTELTTLLTDLAATITAKQPHDIQITLSWQVIQHQFQAGLSSLTGVKNIIAIASGKGGVGKSTTTVNLALALASQGATVGILDADIYGPSQPRMLGDISQPESEDGKSILPLQRFGIQSMSIGYLIDEEEPMVWRGPMVTQALQQLLNDTRWQAVDYLFIDLPPGTGDIQLTLSQRVPVSGAVIVTTPQDIALLDARKALKMFEKVKVPVLGVVENMSLHICSQCGHQEAIFGSGGGESMAAQYAVNLLGALPLDIAIREQADVGVPIVAAQPDSDIAQIYGKVAAHLAATLASQGKDYSSAFPNIVVKND